jgi:hypothetical protein
MPGRQTRRAASASQISDSRQLSAGARGAMQGPIPASDLLSLSLNWGGDLREKGAESVREKNFEPGRNR